jgi:neutral ceramidase
VPAETRSDIAPTRAPSPLDPFVDGRTRRARFSVAHPAPAALPRVERLLAGAAVADLTPPPGLPKAGYTANAHDGDGFRTRLRARVLHLRAGTTSVALVQCDLLGGSSILQHLVASAIAEATDVPLAGVMIGATHTHAGPGQFLGTDFYNRFASNRSGFDPAFTRFLVDQIAEATRRAVAGRTPARIAIGEVDVWGATRNRSHEPHVRNDTVGDKRTDPQRKFVAVNPALELVRVDAEGDDGSLSPLAAVVVFSVHGTGIPMRAREYNADLWAYLVGELGDRVEAAQGTRPVIGAIEGTHADVAPAIRPGAAGHIEAARVGRGIGAKAAELYERLGTQLVADIELGVGLREVDLDTAPSAGGVTLPRRPAVGAALGAGAHENLTPVIWRVPPFAPGRPKRHGTANPQGPKWVIGTRWLQPVILPLASFPRILPVQVVRLGSVALVGLPFEVTVESGRRVAAAVREAVGSTVERVVVSSVANEYSGYVATAEEYARQHYEGGHTLYGPTTQPFLAACAARLAADVERFGVVADLARERRWDLKVHRYLPEPTGREVARRVVAEPSFTDPTSTRDGYWSLEWLDVAPGDLHWHEPLVRVEVEDGSGSWELARHDGRRVDDQGWELEVTHLGPARASDGGDAGHRYRVRWYDPVFAADRRHRFVIVANADQPALESAPFD